uniref:ATP synthase subunit a n=1 Tax=Perumytilus purpuratus TaxID=390823 RepID=A0A346KL37_PERPP|nr:ATP synthase F0 subunit 6 [Perumytilus purpuratus]
MLMDVFSVFDDKNFNSFPVSGVVWILSLFFLLSFVNKLLWSQLSGVKNIFVMLNLFSLDIVNKVAGFRLTGYSLIISSLFVMLLWSNLTSCTPYFFPLSCHMPFSVLFSMSIWVSLVLSSLFNSWEQVIGSLVPSGSPMSFSPLLVVIEIVSSGVRPMTLVMRLVFNLVTGQILFGLLSEMLEKNVLMLNIFNVGLLGVAMVVYFLFEFVVCFLQSYIFCVLLCMYSEDHSSWH